MVFYIVEKIWIKGAQGRKNYEFFGAPVGMFVTVPKAMMQMDEARRTFIQSVCLAAKGKGLDTCLQEAWAGFPVTLKKHLNYTDDEIWCGISMG